MKPDAFETPGGTSVAAVTAAEMRAVDRVATEDVGLDLLVMMENAGRTLAAVVRDRTAGTVTVLAGGGGNGGGGLAGARHLANAGVSVDVVLDRPAAALEGAAARQHGVLESMGVSVAAGPERVGEADVVVDALVGYGLEGPLSGAAADLVEAVRATDADVVCLDVPSGLDATTGGAAGEVVRADCVLTLALPKTGLVGYEGRLLLADIGIPAVVYDRLGVPYESPFRDGSPARIEPR